MADDDDDLAWTVAVVGGRTKAEVVLAYGGDPERPIGSLRFDATFDLVPEDDLGRYFFIQTLTDGDHVVVLENNGWAGADAGLACRVSRDGGTFFSVYWSPSGTRIVQAADGVLVADFDPLFVGQPAGAGDTYPAWLSETVFGAESLRSVMLEAMERQTGVAVDRDWLTRELKAWRVPGIHENAV